MLQITDNPILSIQKYADFQRDIVPVFQNAQVEERVKDLEKTRYTSINVAQSMKKLVTVGELISVAYAGSKGFKCNALVVRLLANYQTLGKDSQIACSEFLMASMTALQYHNMALKMVAKKRPDKAFQVLAATSKVAAKMVMIADGLVTKAQTMCDLATDALEAASTDNSIASDKKKEIVRMMAELNAQKDELDMETSDLRAQVTEARQGEHKAAQQADEARSQGFTIALVGAFMGPLNGFVKVLSGKQKTEYAPTASPTTPSLELERLVGSIEKKKAELAKAECALEAEKDAEKKQQLKMEIVGLTSEIKALDKSKAEARGVLDSLREQKNKEADSASEREARLHEERVRLQERERTAHADLAGAVARLKGTTAENDTIGQALASLDLAIKSLGRIKTVFENTRAYWEAVKSHCDKLADVSDLKMFQDMEDEFIEAITDSWCSWLVLGKINHTAVTTMESVMAKVDGIMDDLPTADEAKLRLAPMFEQIEIEMKQESASLDAAAP